MLIRDATAADCRRITAIYAHHVLHGTGTFEEEPPDRGRDGRALARSAGRRAGPGWWREAPDGARCIGYAYFAQFRDRSAYRFTAREQRSTSATTCAARASARRWCRRCWSAPTAAGFRQMLAVIGD